MPKYIKVIKKGLDNQNQNLRYYEVGYLSREEKRNILESGWYVYDIVDLPKEDYVIVEQGRINNIGHLITNIKLDLETFSENISYISSKGLTSGEFALKYPDAEELSRDEYLLLKEDMNKK
jgi:hypothetical protein